MQNEPPPQTIKSPSTGPRTPAGKAISSRNAVTHGIMAPHPGIIETMETERDWDRHMQGIIADLAPDGVIEEQLAERVASLLWRLRRVTRFESAIINHSVAKTRRDLRLADRYLAKDPDNVPDPSPLTVAAYKEVRVLPSNGDMDSVIRYEAHIQRQLVQTLHELEARQARRNGEQSHLARVDISSPPPWPPPASRPSRSVGF